MRHLIFIRISVLILIATSCNVTEPSDGNYKLTIFATNDVHGKIFPYDYIDSLPLNYSLSSAVTIIEEKRGEVGESNVILIDNGDHLQGDNSAYYYNFIDTSSTHIFSEVFSWMRYDAVVVGNHDIEAGHDVYDRLFNKEGVPYIAANIINLKRGLPYFEPYRIIKRNGLKIAVIGMTNPNIKKWLSEDLWSGMEFEEILPTLQVWVDKIIKKEKPHIVIAAIHAGLGELDAYDIENPARFVAANTNGIDIVLSAHDHKATSEKIFNGMDTVLLLSGGGRSSHISMAEISLNILKGKIAHKHIEGRVISLTGVEPHNEFVNFFKSHYNKVKVFTNTEIGKLLNTVRSRDAYAGPSSYIDMIHKLQLENTGADISFAAPLSLDITVMSKTLNFQDLFSIYPFENQLYVISMTGKEIKAYLEYSYSKWINMLNTSEGHLLMINPSGKGERGKFKNPFFNFDSAAGIKYEVDTRKDLGERINIISMADGSPFKINSEYKVAMSSYRANGGGDLLTEGSGLSKNELEKRVYKKMGDIREIMYNQIKRDGFIEAIPLYNWKFIPEKAASEQIQKDLNTLFGPSI